MDSDKERRKKVGRTWEKTLGETWDLSPVSGGRNTEMGQVGGSISNSTERSVSAIQ